MYKVVELPQEEDDGDQKNQSEVNTELVGLPAPVTAEDRGDKNISTMSGRTDMNRSQIKNVQLAADTSSVMLNAQNDLKLETVMSNEKIVPINNNYETKDHTEN